MYSPKVAIVILNWNGKSYLEQFLPSVRATDYPNAEIHIADNGSTDDSLDFLKAHFPDVSVLSNSGNVGFAQGYNEALTHIEADYYVLLNQDVSVTPNWVTPIIELMESDRTIGACQPKIRAWHNKTYFEYAGAAGGWIDRYGYPFCRGRIFHSVEKDVGQYDDVCPVFWASGAALFIRASLYHEAGGLDPDFFAHMEEIDLCWRLQRLGHQIMVCPRSVVFHVGGGSLPQGNPRKTYLNFRNNLIMLYKNLSPEERPGILFTRMSLDGIAAIKGLFGKNISDVRYIWKAHRSFYKWWVKNKKMQDLIPRPSFYELPGVYKDSIVWQYFIEKKKLFSALPNKINSKAKKK